MGSGGESLKNLKVPNVQELAATLDKTSEIPQRYIWPEAIANPVQSNISIDDLPIVDLGRLLDPALCQEESAKLEHACQEWGIFLVVNHGISKELLSKIKDDITEFFKLPLKEKEIFAQIPNNFQGYGQAFVASEKQKLVWADMLYLVSRPPTSRDMRFWPSKPPTFRESLDKFSCASKEIAISLLTLMSGILGVDPEAVLDKFKDEPQALKANYYPPCSEADKVLGVKSHTDTQAITVLLQVSDVQGLQVNKDGRWSSVHVPADDLVVFIGDALEILSNGKFKAMEHRVAVHNTKERISIAAFLSPTDTAIIGPLPELVRGSSEKYKSVSYADYRQAYIAARQAERSSLESMKSV